MAVLEVELRDAPEQEQVLRVFGEELVQALGDLGEVSVAEQHRHVAKPTLELARGDLAVLAALADRRLGRSDRGDVGDELDGFESLGPRAR